MKLRIPKDWLLRMLEDDPHEPTGLLACSPELMAAMEKRAGRKWDGTQEDAERLVFGKDGIRLSDFFNLPPAERERIGEGIAKRAFAAQERMMTNTDLRKRLKEANQRRPLASQFGLTDDNPRQSLVEMERDYYRADRDWALFQIERLSRPATEREPPHCPSCSCGMLGCLDE